MQATAGRIGGEGIQPALLNSCVHFGEPSNCDAQLCHKSPAHGNTDLASDPDICHEKSSVNRQRFPLLARN